MEKQAERRREQEPIIFSRLLEERYKWQQSEADKIAALPRVVKYDSVPWVQNAQAHVKYWTTTLLPLRLQKAPIFTFSLLQQLVAPGNKSGKHRHYFEAIFYILEGEGYEIHDGIKYPWEAGDVMCVPTYCIHQHFCTNKDSWARFLFSTPTVFDFSGIGKTEQIELHPNYRYPEDGKLIRNTRGDVIGYETKDGTKFVPGTDADFQKTMDSKKSIELPDKPNNVYDEFVKEMGDQNKWREGIPHVVKGRDCPWENTRMGKIKYLISPYRPSPLLVYDCFIQEIPPGGKSGVHRHISEEAHQILDGKGYDIQDGKRHDWETNDIVFIPINTVHQHVNADPKRTATFVAFQSRLYKYFGHGGFEHIEDAPGYKG